MIGACLAWIVGIAIIRNERAMPIVKIDDT